MPNVFITPSIIAKEAIRLFENMCRMAKLVNTGYSEEFHKVGDTITIRLPVIGQTVDGPDITGQIKDIEEKSTTFKLNYHKTAPIEVSVTDLTLKIEQFSERYLRPHMIKLVDDVDMALTGLYPDVYNAVGTAGVTPSKFAHLGASGKLLDKLAVPKDERRLVLDPDANWAMADDLKGLYAEGIVRPAVERGYLGRVAGHELYESQNIRNHTKGVATGTPLVNGASQTGASLITNGWTNSTTGILKKGDVFTITGVNSVNKINKQNTGELQQFVATADVDSGASTGPATIPISPEIILTGAYQNVTALPAHQAPLTVTGSHAANLAFHKYAFGLATAPIELPPYLPAAQKARVTHNNITMTVIGDFQVLAYSTIVRIDILFGTKVLDAGLACRLLG